jgi:hypothetical protein
MKTEKKEFKVRNFSSKKVNPKFYSATPEELNNPEYRTAVPTNQKNKFGQYQNGKIISIRSE